MRQKNNKKRIGFPTKLDPNSHPVAGGIFRRIPASRVCGTAHATFDSLSPLFFLTPSTFVTHICLSPRPLHVDMWAPTRLFSLTDVRYISPASTRQSPESNVNSSHPKRTAEATQPRPPVLPLANQVPDHRWDPFDAFLQLTFLPYKRQLLLPRHDTTQPTISEGVRFMR